MDELEITREFSYYIYNKESTDVNLISLPIDKDKFKEHGMKSQYPNDVQILKRYIK